MKFVDVDGVGRVSRIGLGTWQFGSREWGYGDSYAAGAAGDIVRRRLVIETTFCSFAFAHRARWADQIRVIPTDLVLSS